MGAFHSPSELCYITCRAFVVFGWLAVLQFGCSFRRQFLYRMTVSARDPSLNVNIKI